MNAKITSGLILAAFLTGCGGANDHPEELLGAWKSECKFGVQETVTFDSQLTMRTEAHGESSCTEHRGEALELKADVLYDPELKTTSSGIEALKAQITITDFIITPYNTRSVEQYKEGCPEKNWALGQETSAIDCERYNDDFELVYPSLFHINNNILYSSLHSEPKDADGYPSDVYFDTAYTKQ